MNSEIYCVLNLKQDGVQGKIEFKVRSMECKYDTGTPNHYGVIYDSALSLKFQSRDYYVTLFTGISQEITSELQVEILYNQS